MKARAATQLAKAWAAELCAIETGRLLWRVASTWIDESDGTYCAEFTHVSIRRKLVAVGPVLRLAREDHELGRAHLAPLQRAEFSGTAVVSHDSRGHRSLFVAVSARRIAARRVSVVECASDGTRTIRAFPLLT